MAGEFELIPDAAPVKKYDIENIKNWPEVLHIGDLVSFTEKLHGSLLAVSAYRALDSSEVKHYVTSKGMLAKGLCVQENETNIYWRTVRQYDLLTATKAILEKYNLSGLILFGEVLGVQDLRYELAGGQLAYRSFDLYMLQAEGSQEKEKEFTSSELLSSIVQAYGIETVPFLYKGPFSPEILEQYTEGKSTIANHIREGIVIKAEQLPYHYELGRVILKSVSAAYLTRKGETTEFE
jgi:RNA ligase (TIGR02306 family)